MAQKVNKQKLNEEKVDSLVAQQLAGFITRISKKFYFSEIRVNLLKTKKKDAEISDREILDSIKRLIASDSLQIKMSNVYFLPPLDKLAIDLTCNVKLAQKTQKEA